MEQKYVEILKSYADHDMNAVQTGTAGGPVVENFQLCEVVM